MWNDLLIDRERQVGRAGGREGLCGNYGRLVSSTTRPSCSFHSTEFLISHSWGSAQEMETVTGEASISGVTHTATACLRLWSPHKQGPMFPPNQGCRITPSDLSGSGWRIFFFPVIFWKNATYFKRCIETKEVFKLFRSLLLAHREIWTVRVIIHLSERKKTVFKFSKRY